MAAADETPRGLSSQILNIYGVLTRRFILKVPRYQRPYTWAERHVQRLIQDLLRAYKSRAEFYFIGQIVLVKADQNRLEISDGQQRLATLTMILAYVRDRLPHRAGYFQSLIMSNDGKGQPRLLLREDDTGFFWGNVQEAGHMKAMCTLPDTGIDSRDLMRGAARTIDAELRSMSDRDLDAFMSYVVRATTLNVIDAEARGSAATVYNTVNDRGLELSAADNIKCDLLENSRLKPEDADAAARKWEELEDQLGRWNFAKLLGQMPFLLTGGEMVAPSDLQAFRERIETAGGVRRFLFERLPQYAAALHDILYTRVDVGSPQINADINRRIKMMMLIDKEWPWSPAAIACLAERKDSPESVRLFFQHLECYSFAVYLTVIDIRERMKRFADAARGASTDAVFLPGGPLSLTPEERSQLVAKIGRPFNGERSVRRLMLIRVEAAMPGGHVLSTREDVTVEHIMPRSGGAWWNERFLDKLRREKEANLLGNLTLITERQNKDADNKSFPDKKAVYFNQAKKAGQPDAPVHAVTRALAQIEHWDHDVIGARTDEMARILTDDWGLGDLH